MMTWDVEMTVCGLRACVHARADGGEGSDRWVRARVHGDDTEDTGVFGGRRNE